MTARQGESWAFSTYALDEEGYNKHPSQVPILTYKQVETKQKTGEKSDNT